MYQAPLEATRLVELCGLDVIAQLPGVTKIVPNRIAGDDIDWRVGTMSRLFTVYGIADCYEGAGVKGVAGITIDGSSGLRAEVTSSVQIELVTHPDHLNEFAPRQSSRATQVDLACDIRPGTPGQAR